MDVATIGVALIDGLVFGALLFMVTSGFSLIFGLEGVLNFSHGTMFMLGGWLGLEAFLLSGSLFFGLLIGFCSLAVLGAVIELSLLRRVFKNEMGQILLTMGILYLIHYLCVMQWGLSPFGREWIPSYLIGPIGDSVIEKYKIFLIILCVIVFTAVYILLQRTKLGLIVRAGIDDSEMVEAMGINVKMVFTIVFALGCGLAGLGGAAAVPWLGAKIALEDYLLYAFAIVVIGGVGSFEGSFLGAMIVGITDKFMAYFFPQLVGIDIFLIMLLILILRPEGLVRR